MLASIYKLSYSVLKISSRWNVLFNFFKAFWPLLWAMITMYIVQCTHTNGLRIREFLYLIIWITEMWWAEMFSYKFYMRARVHFLYSQKNVSIEFLKGIASSVILSLDYDVDIKNKQYLTKEVINYENKKNL